MTECTECGKRETAANGLCRRCYNKQYRADNRTEIAAQRKQYSAEHRAEKRMRNAQYRAARGGKTMSENRDCPAFLGVHVAERESCGMYSKTSRRCQIITSDTISFATVGKKST